MYCSGIQLGIKLQAQLGPGQTTDRPYQAIKLQTAPAASTQPHHSPVHPSPWDCWATPLLRAPSGWRSASVTEQSCQIILGHGG